MPLLSKTIFLLSIMAVLLPSILFAQVSSIDVLARRAELERELAAIEAEIGVQRDILQAKQRDSISLERDIAILNAKIQSAELSIRARDLTIRKLTADITRKENTISDLSEKIVREKDSMGQLLRKTNRLDSCSLAEVILSRVNLSEFFRDVEFFSSIKVALQGSFKELESTKKETRQE